jgi:hypothetical protein
MAIGRLRFLALYLLSALAGSAFVYWFSPQFTPTLGASGAVFGLMGALLVLSLKVKANPQQSVLDRLNFVFTFLYPNISWQGHLGGFLGGALIARCWSTRRAPAYLLAGPGPRRHHRVCWWPSSPAPSSDLTRHFVARSAPTRPVRSPGVAPTRHFRSLGVR